MTDCVICRYWSERLEEARIHGSGKIALKQERSLLAALRTHHSGACAYRFPDLLRDLVKQERKLPDRTPCVCDPVRARILTNNRCNELGVAPTYEWQ
jgi:hypothetical protein